MYKATTTTLHFDLFHPFSNHKNMVFFFVFFYIFLNLFIFCRCLVICVDFHCVYLSLLSSSSCLPTDTECSLYSCPLRGIAITSCRQCLILFIIGQSLIRSRPQPIWFSWYMYLLYYSDIFVITICMVFFIFSLHIYNMYILFHT